MRHIDPHFLLEAAEGGAQLEQHELDHLRLCEDCLIGCVSSRGTLRKRYAGRSAGSLEQTPLEGRAAIVSRLLREFRPVTESVPDPDHPRLAA